MERVWWKEAVGYEVYPRSFKDTNGDGVGDLRGIVEKLPYLKELGVDFLWICPFYPSPMRDNGYDVADYLDIDPLFGTMKDMDLLLERAKELGMRIIIDMVLNHTSSEHRWFQEALRDKNSSYRDYYIFRESRERPSNARGCFGGSVWEETEKGVWYYHTFDKTQPDLNWENKELRREIYEILDYWLQKGVSGFRLDAITYIKKGASLQMAEPDGEDGLHDVGELGQNQPGIGEFLLEMREKCMSSQEIMTVAEAPGVPYEELGAFIGEKGYFSMVFDFSYADIDLAPGGNWYNQSHWTFGELKRLIFRSQLSVQKQGWGAVYLENHDQSRSLNKYFRDKAAEEADDQTRFLQSSTLGTLLFGLRGTVFLYQGEELGMMNCPFDSVKEFNDLNTIDQYGRAVRAGFGEKEAMKFAGDRSRDNSRTPYPWSSGENGGFTTGKPWLKVNPDFRRINVQEQLADDDSLFHYYQKLIRIKKSREYRESLVYGKIREIEVPFEQVIAFERVSPEGRRVSVYVNMEDQDFCVQAETGECITDNYGTPRWEKNCLQLRAYEAVMLSHGQAQES